MKKQIRKNGDLVSLNEKLITDYSIQELEQRLETNPLFFGLGDDGTTDNSSIVPRGNCTEVNTSLCMCDNLTCGCDTLGCVCDTLCNTFCLDLPGCITK